MITDHEALKGLLNTPHLSGKLERWGLAIQELDLKIHSLLHHEHAANGMDLLSIPL